MRGCVVGFGWSASQAPAAAVNAATPTWHVTTSSTGTSTPCQPLRHSSRTSCSLAAAIHNMETAGGGQRGHNCIRGAQSTFIAFTLISSLTCSSRSVYSFHALFTLRYYGVRLLHNFSSSLLNFITIVWARWLHPSLACAQRVRCRIHAYKRDAKDDLKTMQCVLTYLVPHALLT